MKFPIYGKIKPVPNHQPVVDDVPAQNHWTCSITRKWWITTGYGPSWPLRPPYVVDAYRAYKILPNKKNTGTSRGIENRYATMYVSSLLIGWEYLEKWRRMFSYSERNSMLINSVDWLILLSGWWLSPTPLKNDRVRQLGWKYSQYMESHKNSMVPNHQPVVVEKPSSMFRSGTYHTNRQQPSVEAPCW